MKKLSFNRTKKQICQEQNIFIRFILYINELYAFRYNRHINIAISFMLVKNNYKNFICFTLVIFFCTLNYKTAFSCYPVAKKDFFFVKDRSQISWGNDNRDFVVYDNFTYPLNPGSQMPFVTPSTNEFVPADIITGNLPLTDFFRKSLISEDHLSNHLYANLKLKNLIEEYAQVQKSAHELINGIENEKANAANTANNAPRKHMDSSPELYDNESRKLQVQKSAHETANGAENRKDIATKTETHTSKKQMAPSSASHPYDKELKELRIWEKRSHSDKETARIASYITIKRQEIADGNVENYHSQTDTYGQDQSDLLLNSQYSSLASYYPISTRTNQPKAEEYSTENKKPEEEDIDYSRKANLSTLHYYMTKVVNYLMDNKLEALIYLLILFIPGFLSSTSRSS